MDLTSTKLMYCIADKCIKKNIDDITQMKLFKLTYFAYAWYGVVYNKKLTNEEPFAYQYGPVFKNARQEMMIFDRRPLTINDIRYGESDLENEVSKFLDKIITQYGEKSAYQLSELSHNDLWKIKHNDNNQLMTYSEIRDFYKNKFIECVNIEYDKEHSVWIITSNLIDGLVLEYSDYSLFLNEINDICLDLIKDYAS